MKVRIQRWGNSLGLRIPRTFAKEIGLEPDNEVDLSLVDGKIVVTPMTTAHTLEALLANVTEDNLHGEISAGAPVGGEVW
jgi:antitoxin MazE